MDARGERKMCGSGNTTMRRHENKREEKKIKKKKKGVKNNAGVGNFVEGEPRRELRRHVLCPSLLLRIFFFSLPLLSSSFASCSVFLSSTPTVQNLFLSFPLKKKKKRFYTRLLFTCLSFDIGQLEIFLSIFFPFPPLLLNLFNFFFFFH